MIFPNFGCSFEDRRRKSLRNREGEEEQKQSNKTETDNIVIRTTRMGKSQYL